VKNNGLKTEKDNLMVERKDYTKEKIYLLLYECGNSW
jgi:hypothetical protein